MRSPIKRFWYNLVARDLLQEIERRIEYYLDILDAYMKMNKRFQEAQTELNRLQHEVSVLKSRQSVGNSDGAIAVQVIKERMSEGLPEHVASARSHGLRVRNEELVRENTNLRRLLYDINHG